MPQMSPMLWSLIFGLIIFMALSIKVTLYFNNHHLMKKMETNRKYSLYTNTKDWPLL